jgi:hypothetical protein
VFSIFFAALARKLRGYLELSVIEQADTERFA